MRKMKVFRDEDEMDVYQDEDLRLLGWAFAAARDIWYEEWEKQGSTDEGSVCLGKGLEVWHIAPRKRNPRARVVVPAPPVQGNLSASRSHAPALEFLKSVGVEATYYDGWMD